MSPPAQVFLKPGEFYFGAGRVRVGTLLGSCVTVTLWHRQAHCGGMCHFMLPERRHVPRAPPDGRYAREAFELFDRAIARHGTRPTDYEAKLFGGGNMFPRHPFASGQNVGHNNIAAARALLRERHIGLAAEHVGGAGHRRLYFDLWSGEVWLSFQNLDERTDKERE